jgi:predicted nucleic acid-binding protein
VVLDASAGVELMLGHDELAARIGGRTLLAPAHFHAEVSALLRRFVRGRALDEDVADACVMWLARLPIQECPLAPLLEPAWQRRHSLWILDAFYVELAVQRGATLVTCDAAMADAAGELGEYVSRLKR